MGWGSPREGLWGRGHSRQTVGFVPHGAQAQVVAGCGAGAAGDGLWGALQAAAPGRCCEGWRWWVSVWMALTSPHPGPQCRGCWLLIISGYQGRCKLGIPVRADITWLFFLPGSQDHRAGSDWPSSGCCAGMSVANCSS